MRRVRLTEPELESLRAIGTVLAMVTADLRDAGCFKTARMVEQAQDWFQMEANEIYAREWRKTKQKAETKRRRVGHGKPKGKKGDLRVRKARIRKAV